MWESISNPLLSMVDDLNLVQSYSVWGGSTFIKWPKYDTLKDTVFVHIVIVF